MAVIILFCIIPLLAWAAPLWAMTGYALTGAKMKEIQAVNAARRSAVAAGATIEQAMKAITTMEQAKAFEQANASKSDKA